MDTKSAIKGYSADKQYQSKLKASEEKAILLQSDLDLATNEMFALNKDIAAINAELSKFGHKTNLLTVLEHQKAIETEQTELDKYHVLIEDQNSKIAAASIREDKVTPLIRHREELLADIALGKAPADNLGKLDDEIDQARKAQEAEQVTNDKIIIDAQNTIAGLERGTHSIKIRIAKLNHLTPGILDYLVMGMAQQSAEDFNRLAQEMAQKLIELVALDKMVSEFGKRNHTGLFHTDWWAAQIPNVGNVPPCVELSGDANHFINTNNSKIYVKEAIQQLKQNMIIQGINL